MHRLPSSNHFPTTCRVPLPSVMQVKHTVNIVKGPKHHHVWVGSSELGFCNVSRHSYNTTVPAEGPLWNWSSLGEQSFWRFFCQRQTLVSLWRLWGLACSIIINPTEVPCRYSNYSLLKIRRGSGSRLHCRFYELQTSPQRLCSLCD